MKAHSLKLAVVAFAAAALVSLIVPEAFAAVLSLPSHLPPHAFEAATLATVAIATLRTEHADLIKRAATKLGEIREGLTPEQLRAIEDEHQKLLADVATKQREIDDAVAAEQRSLPHTWTGLEISRLTARAAAFGLDAAAATTVMADPAIRSMEAATDALQTRAVERSASQPRQVPHARIGRDEGDTLRAAVGDAILLRANPQAIAVADQAGRDRVAAAREWRGMSLLEMGRAFLEQSHGLKLRGLSKMELATVLMGLDTLGRSAGMMSTADFANVLANVVNKRLRDAYAQAPSNWKLLGRQSNSADFKQKSVVVLSSAPAFKEVREGAEFTYGGMTDGVEKYALGTYGRIVTVTRQTLINDDLGAFDRLPVLLGRQAAELEARLFWSILTANANLSDGVALFHATHGNLAGAGTVIDTTNLGKARAAMRKQVSLAGKAGEEEALNIAPRFLVTGPDKEVEAQQALTAVLAAQGSNVNVFAGSLTPITEARLTGNAWYLVADPMTIDTIEYSYLEGEEGLFVEQRIGFEVDGIEIKGRVDFAAKAIDFRGMYKNPGA